MNNYTKEAEILTGAILKLAANADGLENFECYLAHCFGEWLKKYAATPADMAAEFNNFAMI